ncbi:MAG: hypothetical protein QM604_05910 [Microbacterium sp.]
MSTVTTAATRPLRADEAGAELPQRTLRPLGKPARRRPKLAYGIFAVTGALAIAAAQMLLSVLSTQSSFQIAELTSQQQQLTWQKQILYDEVAGLSSPQYLAANAAALGMVIDEAPSYLRLSDGAILGTSQAAADASSVDALDRGLVANSLVTDTPLVTDPDATIAGVQSTSTDTTTDTTTETTTPPALTEGLPTPDTH